MKKLDPQYRLVFGAGGELLCTSDVERMVAEITKLAPADAPQFRRFMSYNRVKLAGLSQLDSLFRNFRREIFEFSRKLSDRPPKTPCSADLVSSAGS